MVSVHDIKSMHPSCRKLRINPRPWTWQLMLNLMEKHPGASESSLLALFQNVSRERPEVLRAIVGHFMKHSGPSASAVLARQIAALETHLSNTHSKAVQLLLIGDGTSLAVTGSLPGRFRPT